MVKKTEITNCPNCNSENIILKKKAGYAVMLSIVFMGIPFPFMKKRYFCFDCAHEWKIEDQS